MNQHIKKPFATIRFGDLMPGDVIFEQLMPGDVAIDQFAGPQIVSCMMSSERTDLIHATVLILTGGDRGWKAWTYCMSPDSDVNLCNINDVYPYHMLEDVFGARICEMIRAALIARGQLKPESKP